MRNGDVSFWMNEPHATTPSIPTSPPAAHRTAPTANLEVDVAIVGAGFTGLWAARRVLEHDPALRVALFEAKYAGWGSSGRNDGWASALMSGDWSRFAKRAGREAVVAFQRRMIDAVDELLAALRAEGIDADAAKGGHLRVARTPAALARLARTRESFLKWGYEPGQLTMLDRDATRARIDVSDAVGGLHDATTARLDPGKAVRGLALAVERRGAIIHEDSPVAHVGPGGLTLASGVRVTAPRVLVATEAYTSHVGGMPRRGIVPVNSSIVMTRPLTDAEWARIGWSRDECFGDAAHVFTYAQRTADGRIAIGGRGKPYHYGSGTGGDGGVDAGTIRVLTDRLYTYFPELRDGAPLVDHAWCGVIGVTRDWCAHVHYDPATGLGSAGGYAGHGVTTSYLAACTLADRALGLDTEDARLPWFGYRSPTWEPEPIRWLGVTGMYRLFALADGREERTHATETSWLARVGAKITGLG